MARGVRLAWRRRADVAAALCFFLLAAWLFPLVMAPRAVDLPAMAPAVVWVSALLSIVMGGMRLFQEDAANGTLEHMLLAPRSTAAVAGVMAVHWMSTCLPLLCALPIVAAFYDLTMVRLNWLAASLLLGTPALCTVTALAAALSLGARSGMLWLTVVSLPLALPVVLFAVQAAQGDAAGGWHQGALLLLGATATASLALGPWSVTQALEVAIE